MSALSHASELFGRTTTGPLRRPQSYIGGAAFFVLIFAAVDGVLLVGEKLSYALLFAALPLGFVLFGRTRTVLLSILLPSILATLIFGHGFAQIKTGPAYILDATVLLVVLLAAPSVVHAIGRFPAVSAVLALFVLITLLQVYEAGATRVVLRQSAIGLYAIWAVVGIVVARSDIFERFIKLMYWGSAAAMTSLAVAAHDVSHGLYVSYGVFFALFMPNALPRRWMAYPVVFAEVALLAVGHVRSIWVALPAAIVATLLVCGGSRAFKAQLLRVATLVVLLALITAAVRPSTIGSLKAQANSIFNYSGTTTADNNAKWRLSNWRYGMSEIEKHPLTGIGFGGPEVPPAVCTTGCNNLTANHDPTVLPGSDLHNSILAIALRLGLPAFLVFIAFEALVVRRARSSGRSSETTQWLLACHMLTGFAALTAVVLEGPYMGIFFWFFGGLVIGYVPHAGNVSPPKETGLARGGRPATPAVN